MRPDRDHPPRQPAPAPPAPAKREVRVTIAPPRPRPGQGLDLIREPGPSRANAIAAAQASLRTHVGLCGDRARAAATFAVDAAVDAAQRTDDERRARAERETRS